LLSFGIGGGEGQGIGFLKGKRLEKLGQWMKFGDIGYFSRERKRGGLGGLVSTCSHVKKGA
jgi:hypothetical protein